MKSPPNTTASASTSCSTASSAHGIAWTSYSAATLIRSGSVRAAASAPARLRLAYAASFRVGDLDEHAAPVARRARTHERAQRAGDAALAADHLADVVLGHVQHEDERAVALLLLHAHGLRIVDQLAREVREQLRHCYSAEMPWTFRSLATA